MIGNQFGQHSGKKQVEGGGFEAEEGACAVFRKGLQSLKVYKQSSGPQNQSLLHGTSNVDYSVGSGSTKSSAKVQGK